MARRAMRITRRSLLLYLLKTANYKPRDEDAYLIVLTLLLEDLGDLSVKRAQHACTQLLQKREHTRRVRTTTPEAPPELPL